MLPPASYLHEKEKIEKRWPAAVRFVQDHKLNEFFDGDADDIGIVMQGGMYNTALRALEVLGLADVFGESRIPLYVLNVTYPLIDAEFVRFCAGKRAILIVEEGQPEFIEQTVNTILRRADIQTRIEGKSMLPMAGEYTGGVMKEGIRKFVAAIDRIYWRKRCRRHEFGAQLARDDGGRLPSPLWRGVGGGGQLLPEQLSQQPATPLPTPPPQGGREQTRVGLADPRASPTPRARSPVRCTAGRRRSAPAVRSVRSSPP